MTAIRTLARTSSAVLVAVLSLGAAPPPPLNLAQDVDMTGAPQQVVFLERDMAPGQTSGLHIHHGVEMNVLLQGTVRLTVQGQAPRVMHRGDSVRIAREVPHEAVNIGRDTVKLIITYVVDKDRPLKEPWPPAAQP